MMICQGNFTLERLQEKFTDARTHDDDISLRRIAAKLIKNGIFLFRNDVFIYKAIQYKTDIVLIYSSI